MSSIKNKYVKIFINFISQELEKYGGKLVIKPCILNKDRHSDGEFSESDLTISCFYDPSSYYWVAVLAHEYAHFLQFKNKEKIWIDFVKKSNEIEDIEKIFKNETSKKNKSNKRTRWSIIKKIIPIELKADKKAVSLMAKFKIPFDKKDFIESSNIILYKYLYWAEKGKWPEFKKNEYSFTKNSKISSMKALSHYLEFENIPKKIFYIFDK